MRDRVAKCHGCIHEEILANWGKSLGEQNVPFSIQSLLEEIHTHYVQFMHLKYPDLQELSISVLQKYPSVQFGRPNYGNLRFLPQL